MPVSSADIILAPPPASAGDSARVLLEQDEWDSYTGYLTRMGALAYLNNLLFGDEDDAEEENCGVDLDGHVRKNVYAYPDPANLHYLIGLSHGEMGPQTVEELEYAEVLNLQADQEAGLKYPCFGIISTSWIVDAYDSEGSPQHRPAVRITGGTQPKFLISTYGALLVTYRVIRHSYAIDVPPRENAGENSLQSFVWAVWPGGNDYMEVDLPDDQEPGDCNNSIRGQGHIGYNGPNRPNSVPPEDEDVYIDYCTQEELA